jgi:hypothetical protein
MSTVHERRIEQEWKLLQALAEHNPELLQDCHREIEAGDPVFSLQLRRTQALIEEAGELRIREEHLVSIHFPRFFPAVPLEVSLLQPVFHPNVHPETGFVCLWNRFSPGDSVVEAVAQLQRVISWELVNEEPDHVMQPRSLEWYKDPARAIALPVPYQTLRRPGGFDLARTYAVRAEGAVRRRLE